MKGLLNLNQLVAAVVYSAVGVIVFFAAFLAVDRATPYDLWAEIVQKQNRALGTLAGSFAIGISIIIAAAIVG